MISPGWATFALAVAALLVGLDHFGGYTSGWVRYMRTAQALTRLQGASQPEDPEQVKAATLLCRKFFQGVYELLRLETELWAQEFQQAL